MIYKSPWLGVFLLGAVQALAALQPQIPSIAQFHPPLTTASAFTLVPTVSILVDPRFSLVTAPGTPIPSRNQDLNRFAGLLRTQIASAFGFDHLPPISYNYPDEYNPAIFLTLDTSVTYFLFNGSPTKEGYDFEISEKSYRISAPEPIGIWWGTRTLLQQAILASQDPDSQNKIVIPAGSGSDSPGWAVRGFMLDVGRHYFSTAFLLELCQYASFFKLNEFHMHSSDNIWNIKLLTSPDWRNVYSGFRFQTDPLGANAGIANFNESWSREEFEELQENCSSFGVRIVPEIDTPAHALPIAKWRPGISQEGRPDLLDLSNPATVPVVQGLWEELLQWFSSSEVSIGADEYVSSLADQYVQFINLMAAYFSSRGRTMRVWGSKEATLTGTPISKNVIIQHWSYPDQSNPLKLLNDGYQVINSELKFLYLNAKTSGSDNQFPWELDQGLMWNGGPDKKGWAPNVFSDTVQVPFTQVGLLGAIMALWNDFGNTASTQLEEYYQLARSLPVFAEKSWAGSGVRASALTQNDFNKAYPILNINAPSQNLNRKPVFQAADGRTIFSYPGVIAGTQITNINSVGPPYTLKFTVRPTSLNGALFLGSDTELWLRELAFRDVVTNVYYPLAGGYTPMLGKETVIEIRAFQDHTEALIEGKTLRWTTTFFAWSDFITKDMSFAAPSFSVGSSTFQGTLSDVSLAAGASPQTPRPFPPPPFSGVGRYNIGAIIVNSVGGSIMKVPQLILIVSAHSARGLSLPAYVFETASYAITLAYAFRNKFPFSTYGENLFLTIQNVVITLLIIYYPTPSLRRSRNITMNIVITSFLMAVSGVVLYACPSDMLAIFQLATLPLSVVSKLPQIAQNAQAQSTGQLSTFAVVSQIAGCLARLFTTATEVGDLLVTASFGLALLLNCVLGAQMWMYWGKDKKVRETELGRVPLDVADEKVQKEKVDTAHPVHSSISPYVAQQPSGRKWGRKLD